MLKEVAMVSVVLALLLLNIIAPTLLGHHESDIATIPMMLLDANNEELQIYIKGALSDNKYTGMSIMVQGIDNESFVSSLAEGDSYVTKQVVSLNETTHMRIDIVANVEDHEWWLNCTVRVEQEDNGVIFWISYEDEDGAWGPETVEDGPFRQRLFLRG
ncbi:MAG: hypothetical protein ACE5QF_05575 [Thermoplasmata archaeon]